MNDRDHSREQLLAELQDLRARAARLEMDEACRRQAEELLLQAQKMEAIGRLAAGVAHEFNNLLTVIMGYGELLEQSFDLSDPRLPQVLEIRKAAERGADLTRQLLAFGHKALVAAVPVDLPTLLREAEDLMRHVLGPAIELVMLPPVAATVQADPAQIRQVLLNLAANARNAMPQGGRLTVQTSHLEVSEQSSRLPPEVRPGPYVLVEVRDTGCGMTKDMQAQIFEPFFTTKQFGKGSGLGLAAVYGIVRTNGGYIEVDSAPDQGATFRIYLPRLLRPSAACSG